MQDAEGRIQQRSTTDKRFNFPTNTETFPSPSSGNIDRRVFPDAFDEIRIWMRCSWTIFNKH
jgi:hypothetical protein